MTHPNFIKEYGIFFYNCEDAIEKSTQEKERLLSLPPFLQTLELNRILEQSPHEYCSGKTYLGHYGYLTSVFLPIIEFIQEHDIYVPLSSVLNFYKNTNLNRTYHKQLSMEDINCCHNSKGIHDTRGKGPCNLCSKRYISAMKYLEDRVKNSRFSDTKTAEVKDNLTRCISSLENKYQELHDYVSIMESKIKTKDSKTYKSVFSMALGVICILVTIYIYYKVFPSFSTSSDLVVIN